MAKLDAAARKRIPHNAFAVPSKAPGSGSYPIEDKAHARDALARSSGKPVAAQVRAAVKRRYPEIAQKGAEGSRDMGHAHGSAYEGTGHRPK